MSAEMGSVQIGVVNSRIRQLFQKYYEFRVLKGQLERNNIDLAGQVILDAGCGSGYSTELIAQEFRPKELYAFDIMPQQVRLAQQRGLTAQVFVGDITNIHLDADQIDAVFTFGVFHHVPEWLKAIQETHRVLKPGGVLLGGEINKEKTVGFEWPKFALDLEKAGFSPIESQKIYLGYFTSFVCRK